MNSMSSSPSLDQYALDAYIYGYTIVLMETTRTTMQAGGLQLNRFTMQSTTAGPGATVVVRPNVDTLYNVAWLDLASEPVVLHVPDTGGKYYVMEFLDAWTNVFASLGPRTTGTDEQVFLIAGPGWSGYNPYRLPVIQSPTNTVWVIGRIQTDGPKDYPLVNALQQGFLLAPFGYWEKYNFSGISNLPVKKPGRELPPPINLVEAMDATTFFTILSRAMAANPPAMRDAAMSQMLAALGLASGASLDFNQLPPATQAALSAAMKAGPAAIRAASLRYYSMLQTNGWSMPVANIGYYGTDYLLRAAVALSFLGANVPQDAVYGFSFAGASDAPFMGNNRYVLHFASGQYPPVNAFWSVTLYNSQGFLTENPINRYAIGPHLGNLLYNPDGSLDILIQHDSPGKAFASNWLPAPDGPFNLLLRLYWPEQAVLSGLWKPAPVLQA